MSNARDHLFKIPFKQYSIPDWEHHKKLILDALPKDDYTDFFALKGKGLPSYISTVGDAIDPCMKDFLRHIHQEYFYLQCGMKDLESLMPMDHIIMVQQKRFYNPQLFCM